MGIIRSVLQLSPAVRFRWKCLLWIAFMGAATRLHAQLPDLSTTFGTAPRSGLGSRNLAVEFSLPPFQNQLQDDVWKKAQELSVFRRASAMKLDERSATEAWADADSLCDSAVSTPAFDAASSPPNVFLGSLASQLNILLAQSGVSNVRVESPKLTLDQPIRFNRSGVRLDLGRAELIQTSAEPYMVRVEGVRGVAIAGGRLTEGTWAVLIANSTNVSLTGMTVKGLKGGGILVTGSREVTIRHNMFLELNRASIVLHGATTRAALIENQIIGDHGSSNWSAGVLLTDRNADVSVNPESLFAENGYWVPEQAMALRTHVPHDNLIADNTIADNASSGIYSDGGNRNVFIGNRVEGNSKEGICLDNGSIANVVAFNLFRANGDRWGKTDADLKLDFVQQFGRLPDGTASAKVPAISLDNAAYNEVAFNGVDQNFGGGIKLVRTAYFNRIGLNTLTSNNRGGSNRFHYFGIELGAAPSDIASKELDFTPSRGNQIFGNNVRGPHYAGIFFAEGSDHNDVFDNAIFGATDWAIESVEVEPNSILNNLTNLRSRNASSGLSPELLDLGHGVFDSPPHP